MLLGGVYALFVSFAFFFLPYQSPVIMKFLGFFNFFFILRQYLILSPLPHIPQWAKHKTLHAESLPITFHTGHDMPAQIKYRSESHVVRHTAPRRRQPACPRGVLRTSSPAGFCCMQNSCAARGGAVGSRLGAAVHSPAVLYAKGEGGVWAHVSWLWRGRKGPVPTTSRLTLPPSTAPSNPSGLRRRCRCMPRCMHPCSERRRRRRHARVLNFCSPFPAPQKPRPPHLPLCAHSVATQEPQLVVFPPGWSATAYRYLMQSRTWVSSAPSRNLIRVKVNSCENILCCCLVYRSNYSRSVFI